MIPQGIHIVNMNIDIIYFYLNIFNSARGRAVIVRANIDIGCRAALRTKNFLDKRRADVYNAIRIA
jgi:hypothetical protein